MDIILYLIQLIQQLYKQNYYQKRYGKTINPVFRHGECNVPTDCTCPQCNAPYHYLMWNDGKKQSQLLCKVCQSLFSTSSEGRFSKIYVLRCPHCNNALVHKKDRKHFIVHKCVNSKCPYYLKNLKKVSKEDLEQGYGKNKYKLHYIYREFDIDFFKMDLNSLPKNASCWRYKSNNKRWISILFFR